MSVKRVVSLTCIIFRPIKGIETHNANSKMAIDKNGKIVHFNCNFIKHSKVKSISPKLKPCQAETKVASHFRQRMNTTLDIK